MKRNTWLAAALWALTTGGLAVPAFSLADVADPVTEDEVATNDEEFGTEFGIDDEDELNDDDEWGYDSTEFSAFEGDDLIEDDFGLYDSDFDWNVDDEDWDAWYEADTELWEDDDDEDGFWDW